MVRERERMVAGSNGRSKGAQMPCVMERKERRRV